MNFDINNKNKERKFKKFANSIHKERILAKIMKYNYDILQAINENNISEIFGLELERDYFVTKVCEFLYEYLPYCVKQANQLLIERKTIDKNNKEKLDKNAQLIAFYKKQLVYYSEDFIYLLDASENCIENGVIIPFEHLDSETKQNVDYESAFDVYLNLKSIDVLGHELADVYYRALILKHDMPIFMTKSEHENYVNLIKEKRDDVARYPELSDVPMMRQIYNKNEEIEKKLYESVFPEFGFKYEDREKDPMIMDVSFKL